MLQEGHSVCIAARLRVPHGPNGERRADEDGRRPLTVSVGSVKMHVNHWLVARLREGRQDAKKKTGQKTNLGKDEHRKPGSDHERFLEMISDNSGVSLA